jgi:hypothetical protein
MIKERGNGDPEDRGSICWTTFNQIFHGELIQSNSMFVKIEDQAFSRRGGAGGELGKMAQFK